MMPKLRPTRSVSPNGAEHADQRFIVGARHLDVEILGFESEQPVAHAAADEPGPAHGAHRAQDRDQLVWQSHRGTGRRDQAGGKAGG